MNPITLSFIVVIKNRTNINVNYAKTVINLKLFENNMRSLIKLIIPEDDWEFVIVDFNSNDVNMHDFINTLPQKDFINTLPQKDNISFNILKVDEKFNKGKGLNIGLSSAKNEITFCLDADMMILSRDIFNDIIKYVINENKVLFPICWSYKDPLHTDGWKRDTGKGNVIQNKNTIIPYIDNFKWGKEDDHNYDFYDNKSLVFRTYYDKNFIHQWHPEEIKHIYYESQDTKVNN
jgi:hypothetical protein